MFILGNQLIELSYYEEVGTITWWLSYVVFPLEAIATALLTYDGFVECWNEYTTLHPLALPSYVSEYAYLTTPQGKLETANGLVVGGANTVQAIVYLIYSLIVDVTRFVTQLTNPNWFMVGKYLAQPGAYLGYEYLTDILHITI